MLKRLVLLSAAAAALSTADDNFAPGAYKSAADWMATLAKNTQAGRDMAAAGIANADHYRINVVRRTAPGPAGAHASGPAKGSELHYIIDGSGTIVTGGRLVKAAGATAAGPGNTTIEGGESRHMTKGDTIFIPEGTPHWYKEVDGSITYLEVRFDVELKK